MDLKRENIDEDNDEQRNMERVCGIENDVQ